MLVRERLPELGADLVAALARLQCHYLTHLGVGFRLVWGEEKEEERRGGKEKKKPGGGGRGGEGGGFSQG